LPQPVHALPCGADLGARVAERILEHRRDRLPDLSGIIVLTPGFAAANAVQRALLDRTPGGALLGPRCMRLADWVLERHAMSPSPFGRRWSEGPDEGREDDPKGRMRGILGPHARELLLVEALHAHARLFGGANPWRLAQALLELFEELTLDGQPLPDDYADFERRLGRAYGCIADRPEPFGREARLVHTLWHAWLEQQRQEGVADPALHYAQALAELTAAPPGDVSLWVAGIDRLRPAEAALLRALIERECCEVFVQGPANGRGAEITLGLLDALATTPSTDDEKPPGIHSSSLPRKREPSPINDLDSRFRGNDKSLKLPDGTDAFSSFVDTTFALADTPFVERAHAFAARHPTSPASARLRLLPADDAETQARAIDVQIRLWLLAGRDSIGVVTEDRRLARRLRALLERAGIALADDTGWALSTTSAAAALERWLECIEEDFAYQPLMDVLKSPFVQGDVERAQHLLAVYRLEQDIVLHENIPRGLKRMRRQLQNRGKRLPDWAGLHARAVSALLDRLEHAAAPLQALADAQARTPAAYLEALDTSLERLGLRPGFHADPAGRRVLEELAAMRADLAGRELALTWPEFRTWLGGVLETRYFRPPAARSRVRLLPLSQAQGARFDALVLAATDHEHLPGPPPARALFNDAVRAELGLATRTTDLALGLHRFRVLLHAAPEVLVCWEAERDGEAVAPSPWVEALETFHSLAWHESLIDRAPARLAHHPDAAVRAGDDLPPPEKPAMPRPSATLAHPPSAISASAHQDLIDCPYRFFAARMLGLAPPEEIAEALRKSDYGERVHLCLQAFHVAVPKLPPPFARPLIVAERTAAIAHLEHISEQVFARDLEDNFIHRGWLARWREHIPQYVDWAIARAAAWRVEFSERSYESELGEHRLKGRLDRVDRTDDGGRAVLDYKTGNPPKQDAVDAGEAVQLPTYALLLEDVRRVEYLKLDAKGKVEPGAALEGEALETLTKEVAARLENDLNAIVEGQALPAWGDDQACRHCRMDVLCRRTTWRS
jgi:ATP-dependent helicase/nuclease subunit B